jgi:uncharacterized protein YlzI (FlbEa/FlbD family)
LALQGKYVVKNKEKYTGDCNNVVYRSSWELQVMVWCDKNQDVVRWGSEVLVINYVSGVDSKKHRYFPDFVILLKSGKKLIVEIKPKIQTIEPKLTAKKSKKRFLTEMTTYIKNLSKWEEAKKYADRVGAEFVVWTEDHLKEFGMRPDTSKAFKVLKFSPKKLRPLRKDRKVLIK